MSKHPLNDPGHKPPADPTHVRLISEGERLSGENPSPVCTDTTRVSAARTFRSSTGTCNAPEPDIALFSVSSEHAATLDQGGIPEELGALFEQRGFPLTSGALVDVQRFERLWVINDQQCSYTIRKLATSLAVYQGQL